MKQLNANNQKCKRNEQQKTTNLAKTIFKTASIVIVGYVLFQTIRLAGNVILTRILAPELFGLVSLARVFIIGLALFSDIGLEPAIIRSSRTHDKNFLNTVWTIQIARGFLLGLLALIIAFPVSKIYNQSTLLALIPVIGIISIITGLQSTSLAVLRRDLRQGMLIGMEITVQLISLAFTILAAYTFRSVWSLLAGEFIGTIIRVVWSHYLNRQNPNHLAFDRAAIDELLGFGKWILITTAIMFLAAQADRLMLGKLFSMTNLGVYTIAATLAEIPKQIAQQLSGKVVFPMLASFSKLERSHLKNKIRVPRLKFLLILIIPMMIFSVFGDYIVRNLYDDRYIAATWIFPLLSIGMWPFLLATSINSTLYVIGKPQYQAFANFAKFLFMLIFVPIAHHYIGEVGVILVIALNDIPSYVVTNYGLYKEKLSLIKQDALLTIVFLLCLLLLISLRLFLGLGLPGI